MICHYCHRDPGSKSNSIWKGFLDADTGQHVCWSCRREHYKQKAAAGMDGLYSEMPVSTFQPQLTLNYGKGKDHNRIV